MPDITALFIFPFFLVLCRMGMAIMLFPALSDTSVSTRTRLILTLAISVMVFPILADQMPALPTTTAQLLFYVFVELVIGIMLALGAKLFMGVLNVGGELIAYTSGFQAATMFDPMSGTNTTALTLFLMLSAGVLIFAFNLHHVLIEGVVESYAVFPAGALPPLPDALEAVITLVSDVFRIGVKLSAPVLVTGFLGYVVFGVFNRLIPQLQVFFVAMPLTITIGMFMFAMGIALILSIFMAELSTRISLFTIG